MTSWQIPRNALAWLLISQLMVIAPHALRLSFWVFLAYIVCAVWRLNVFQGRWSFPHRVIKYLLALSGMGGVYWGYGTFLGLEPMVALLITGFSLKLLETIERKDFYWVIFLAYFVALAAFLFEQSLSMVLYLFCAIMGVTTALVALHQERYTHISSNSAKKTLLLFAQAIPLMVVLFIVFPRFEPLWEISLPSHHAKTGISDQLSPGDISHLARSDELAFRAHFIGDIPATEQLYWRGLVLSHFDGRTWRPAEDHQEPAPPSTVGPDQQGEALYRYRIIQEASYQPWLFSLAGSQSDSEKVFKTINNRLQYQQSIYERINYQAVVWQQGEGEQGQVIREQETQLPPGSNPKSRQLAASFYAQSNTDQAYVERVLALFREQPFSYTLKPPLLGHHSIDEFLLQTRRGFCGHYASSFVFLMRAAGLPARVVNGYMGGEINPLTQAVLVHQFAAHAWAEVWLEDQGWVRVDPTAAVAPERVEQGLEEAVSDFLANRPYSPLRFRDIGWLNTFRLRLDALDYYWARWVLGYRGDQQFDFLTGLLGKITAMKIALILMGVAGLIVFWAMYDLLKQKITGRQPAELRLYLAICRHFEAQGFKREHNEGAIAFARRLVDNGVSGRQRDILRSATRQFVSLNYEPCDPRSRKLLLKGLRRDRQRVFFYRFSMTFSAHS